MKENRQLSYAATQLLRDVVELREEVKAMKEPKGTKANPARSCKDLYFINKNIKDGENYLLYQIIKFTV